MLIEHKKIADKLIGLTKEEAEGLLTAGRHDFRYTNVRRGPTMLCDHRPMRFNLDVRNGIVEGVTFG